MNGLELRESGVQVTPSRRNIFAFAMLRSPRHHQGAPAASPVPTVVPPLMEATHETPREPEFPLRYIGRFGPDVNPIAVFVGDVVNARAGDVVAGRFRLVNVGIDSVDVVSGGGGSRRVSLKP
jgi:hypothetical protein